jgi:hypothetical protein
MSTGSRSLLARLAQDQTAQDADRLEQAARDLGATHIRDCPGGCTITVHGRLRSVTLRPVASAPAVEAELWDGTGLMRLLFLGRRRIPGVTPGRSVQVTGRAILRDGERTMVNPRYRLLPAAE